MKKVIILFIIAFALVHEVSAQLPSVQPPGGVFGIKNAKKAQELYIELFQNANAPLKRGNDNIQIDSLVYLKLYQLFNLSPYATYEFYSGYLYDFEISAYKRWLDNCSDPAIRLMYVEDVINVANSFVNNRDSINVLRTWYTKDGTLSEPMAKIKRAHYNYLFAHNPKYYPSHLYDKEKVYNLYRDAFKDFIASKEQAGTELHAYYVKEYFDVCMDLYKSDEEKYYEQFLNDYLEIVKVCDRLLNPFKNVDKSVKDFSEEPQYKLYRQYNGITNGREWEYFTRIDTIIRGVFYPEYKDSVLVPKGIKPLFEACGANAPEKLRSYYAPRLEKNLTNKAFLDSTIYFMFENKFTNDSLYYKYCQHSYNIEPTFYNCLGMAAFTSKDSVGRAKMIEYYKGALDICEKSGDSSSESIIRFAIASNLFKTRPRRYDEGEDKYVNYAYNTDEYKAWKKNIETCNFHLDEIIKKQSVLLNEESSEIRDYVACAYYMLAANTLVPAAEMLSLQLINDGYNYLDCANKLNIQAIKINGRNVNVHELRINLNKTEEAIKKRLKENINAEKAKKEYEEYIRKKQAEEAFWNQK